VNKLPYDCDELRANATEVQRNAYKEFKKKDCKTLFFVQQSVDSGNFYLPSPKTNKPLGFGLNTTLQKKVLYVRFWS
jgi:hypothetical protein